MSIRIILKKSKVRYRVIGKETYFYVDDIKKNKEFQISDLNKVKYINEIALINESFIKKLSDFDKIMKQILK